MVTLLAILELAKLRVIRVVQDPQSEAFFIAQKEGSSLDVARRTQVTSDIDALVQEIADAPPDDVNDVNDDGGLADDDLVYGSAADGDAGAGAGEVDEAADNAASSAKDPEGRDGA